MAEDLSLVRAKDLRSAGETSGLSLAVLSTLTSVINESYAVAEVPFWSDGYERTTVEQFREQVAGGAVHLLVRHSAGAADAVIVEDGDGRAVEVLGTVNVSHDEAVGDAFLSQLVVLPRHRRRGYARHVLTAVTDWAAARGATTLQLELLLPPTGPHPKDALATFYAGEGFVRQPNPLPLDALYPSLVPMLAKGQSPLLVVFRKPLLL
jgi:GNAT superfamily N-acetyltransferase